MPTNQNCPECDRHWPDSRAFAICPQCRVRCRTSTVGTPLTAEQAKVELKRIEFNRFYQRREAERCGPSPEDLGREEAAEIIQLERWLTEKSVDDLPPAA